MSKYIYVANNLNNSQMLARFAKEGVKGRVGINYHSGHGALSHPCTQPLQAAIAHQLLAPLSITYCYKKLPKYFYLHILRIYTQFFIFIAIVSHHKQCPSYKCCQKASSIRKTYWQLRFFVLAKWYVFDDFLAMNLFSAYQTYALTQQKSVQKQTPWKGQIHTPYIHAFHL